MRNALFWFSFYLLFLVAACQPNKSTDPSGDSEFTVKPNPSHNEDDVMFQLAALLIHEPGNRREEEQNRIVDYAIEKKIPLKRASSGLLYYIENEGEGDPIVWGDYLEVHYRGYFLNGEVFDASHLKGKPITFYVGNMIPAWNEALQMVSPGGRMIVFAPSVLAYGEEGMKGGDGEYIVPPNKVLAFELEVVDRLKRG